MIPWHLRKICPRHCRAGKTSPIIPRCLNSARCVMSEHEQPPLLTMSEAAAFLNLNPHILDAMRRNDVDRDGSPYLTVKEAAAFLRLKPRTLDNMRCNGIGSGPLYSKHGGCIRYRLVDLIAWSRTRRRRSTAEKAD